MRALRVLSLVSILAVGVAGSAMAQPPQRFTAPGVYPAKICVAPGMLPDMGASLPPELYAVDEQVYVGEITISGGSGFPYEVQFLGERADGAKLNAQGSFESDWTGIALGSLFVNSESVSNCLVSINVENLISGKINGVGSFDGTNSRLLAFFGAHGELDRYKFVPAPGPFRR